VGTPIRLFLLCIAAWIAAGPPPARANPSEPIENIADTCARQTAGMERRLAIPRHLLTAISMAESGRWNRADRANVAWPWTVTAEGQGRFFDSKAEAMAEVEFLMTRGVRNIDVGCMQVNLYYHGGAFESLAEALDPAANTAYAASYLKNLHQATGDWSAAAGFYHSTTPERNGPYKEKVLGFWRELAGIPDAARNGPGDTVADGPVTIDHQRTARLNAAFKARRDGGRRLLGFRLSIEEKEAARAGELDAWRDAASRGGGTMHLAAMRQAEYELKRKRALDQVEKNYSDIGFAQRRAKQLREWQMRVAGAGTIVIPASADAQPAGAQPARAEPVAAR
jgi:hypothetical protein